MSVAVMVPGGHPEDLATTTVGDEALVYEPLRRQVHCLSPTTALVWALCDGRRSITDITEALRRQRLDHADDALVALVVRRLESHRLLTRQTAAVSVAGSAPRRAVRSQVKRRGGRRVEPTVTSILLSPVIHAEASGPCRGVGEKCGMAQSPCCPGFTCQTEGHLTGTCG